tara:strand:+ start:9199 stop:9552 length:354 start_codon:yes stop_codon:yes gene_type:complete
MMELSGSGRVGEAHLGNTGNLSLDQVLCVYPGSDNQDRPLPSIEAFDDLADRVDSNELAWLVQWVEPQTTCSYIMRHHGSSGLKRVLMGIARACDSRKVHMGNRVSHFAEVLGLDVI